MASPSFRSDVWEHFRKVNKKAICCHCNKELAYCGGATKLRDRLNRVHPSKYSPDSITPTEKKAAPKIKSFVKRTVCSEGHAKKITNLMVEMMTLDLRPAAMVEGVGFKLLINYFRAELSSSFSCSHHQLLTRALRKSKNYGNSYARRTNAHCSDDGHLDKCGNTVIHNRDCTFYLVKLGA